MKIIIDNITLEPDKLQKETDSIIDSVNSEYKLNISEFEILRKSLDSRNNRNIVYRYRILVEIHDEDTANLLLNNKNISIYTYQDYPAPVKNIKGLKAIVIGTGPAGLFCALRLIQAGAYVDIFEMGKEIPERISDIENLESNGILNEQSNVLFGEGGAGTYSDGKLTTRINRPEIDWFYKQLIECGAKTSILYDSKPHLGTDKLREIIQLLRNRILKSGSSIFFNERVDDILIRDNKAIGIITSSGKEILCPTIILATGHSARSMYELLFEKGVTLEKKGFAVGVRVEHPRDIIDNIQYGNSPCKIILPAADYNLTYNNKKTKRGVYTFCMCPGGSIINSSSENGLFCTNGMSLSSRNSEYSNSAIVVTVNENDTKPSPLSGIDFQKQIEKAAFLSAENSFKSPAQKIKSFLNDKLDDEIVKSSYKFGTVPVMLKDYLPHWIINEIKKAINHFEKRMHGFKQGILVGAETRTSSPVRIVRGEDFQSVSIKGLYPIGEGAGYSGGIVSSAVDGIKAADSIISNSNRD